MGSRKKDAAAELHAERVDALERMRKADTEAATAREAYKAADAAWREHLRDARNVREAV
jgi:hypothetical protein